MVPPRGGRKYGTDLNPFPNPKPRVRVTVKISAKKNSRLLVSMERPKPELSPW